MYVYNIMYDMYYTRNNTDDKNMKKFISLVYLEFILKNL